MQEIIVVISSSIVKVQIAGPTNYVDRIVRGIHRTNDMLCTLSRRELLILASFL